MGAWAGPGVLEQWDCLRHGSGPINAMQELFCVALVGCGLILTFQLSVGKLRHGAEK